MKKLLIGILILATIVGGVFLAINLLKPKEEESTPEPALFDDDAVMEKLNSMSLEEKIAQMLVVAREEPGVSDEELDFLKNTPYGGYIFMGGAYGTLAETRETVETLQSSAKTPLIITTDEEGGEVQRLQSVTDVEPTDIPDMYSVGETGDTEYAKTIGRVLAEELRTIGFNVDMAPDADVFSNPDNTVIGRRSFSSDPNVVAKMSQAVADGLEENGVIATFKHFPGHGDTSVDSHLDLPIIDRSREELDKSDLVPFKNAIKNGAELIMVAHIALPKITGDNTPATLSRKITTELLRDELGYKNLIITDALDMGALVKNYSEEEIYIKAVRAGADLLLMPEDPDLAIQTIKENIPESRINESVYRILKFKQDKLKDYKYLDASYFGNTEHV